MKNIFASIFNQSSFQQMSDVCKNVTLHDLLNNFVNYLSKVNSITH